MDKSNSQLDTLNEIKVLMERSSRLRSLSGLSVIAAGVTAVAGVITASLYLKTGIFEQTKGIMITGNFHEGSNVLFLSVLSLSVVFTALALAVYFSSRNAKRENTALWDAMAKRVFLNHFIFLLTGGLFCLMLLYYGIYFLIVPSMLIFYGLALINLSKFTFNEFAQMGIIEICLGIIASVVTVYPLLMFLTGFGILHLIYGTYIYFKYEKEKK